MTDPLGHRFTQLFGIVRRQIDLIINAVKTESESLVGSRTVEVVFQGDVDSLSHVRPFVKAGGEDDEPFTTVMLAIDLGNLNGDYFVIDPLKWWDASFWNGQFPSGNFDTPSTLCAPLLAATFLTWTKVFGLAGVLEIGVGDGRILDEVGARNAGVPCKGVDVRDVQGGRSWQPLTARWDVAREEWIGEEFLDTDPMLVVALEWLDDLPAVVAEGRGGPVAVGPRGHVGELAADDRAWLERWWPLAPGNRAVVGSPRDRAWQWLAEHAAPGSVLVTIDYGHTAQDRPADGGLAAHVAGRRVSPGPGVNVTAGVAVDSLAAAVESGGAERLRCERLTDLPAGFWGVAGSGLAGLALRSQEALLRDPNRFGGFWLVAHRIPGPTRP